MRSKVGDLSRIIFYNLKFFHIVLISKSVCVCFIVGALSVKEGKHSFLLKLLVVLVNMIHVLGLGEVLFLVIVGEEMLNISADIVSFAESWSCVL